LTRAEVREAFRQQSSSGATFRRRRIVITVTLVLPMLALICAAPFFNAYREQLAFRNTHSRVEHQPTAPPPDAPSPPLQVPGPPTPEAGPEEGAARSSADGTVGQRSRDGTEGVVRLATEGDAPSFSGVRIEYEPHVYKTQSIKLSGDDPEQLSLVFILDCSHSMAAESRVQAGGAASQQRLLLAKNSLNAMLGDIADRNAAGDDTRVGVRFFGHRLGWSQIPAIPPPAGWTPKLIAQSAYRGRKPEKPAPAEDVELVDPLGQFDEGAASEIAELLNSVRPHGETPLYLALLQALDDFKDENPQTRKSIIVITDGQDYQYPHPDFPPPEKITLDRLRTEWRRHRHKIPIHIMGFDIAPNQAGAAGTEFREIADFTDGSYTEIRSGRELLEHLREYLNVDGYFVNAISPDAANRSVPESIKLGTPFEVPNSVLPGDFQVQFRDVRKPVRLEGGEAIELHVVKNGAAHDIVAQDYNARSPLRMEHLTSGAGGESQYILRAHRPVRRLGSENVVEFPISLQRDTKASHFTPRPAETWLEITPLGEDGSGQTKPQQAYVFYDTNFEPDEPVPVLVCPAAGWRDWPKAKLRFWCKSRLTEPVLRIGLRDATYRTLKNVPEVNGVQVRVETSESGGVYRVVVAEKHGSESPGVSDALRIGFQTDPYFKPIRVRHQFDSEAGIATHSFEFQAADRAAIERFEGSQVVVTRASDIKDGALQISGESELEVSVPVPGGYRGIRGGNSTVGSQAIVGSRREMFEISVDAPDGISSERNGSIVLHPLPNRIEHFGFNLSNLTNLKRNVTVGFIAPNRIPPDDVIPRFQMNPSEAGAVLSQFGGKELTWPLTVELPASSEATRIKFTPPADQNPPVQPNLLISNPAEFDKPPRIDLPYGLILVVEDVEASRTTLRRVLIEPQLPRLYLAATADVDAAGNVAIHLSATNSAMIPPEGIPVSAKIEGISAQLEHKLDGIITAPSYSAVLSGRIDANARSELNATVDVGGYPRAFIFRIPRGSTGNIEPAKDTLDVRIVSPEPDKVFKASPPALAVVPVKLLVDAPHGAFSGGGEAHVAVGIDSNRDGRLSDENIQPQRFFADRQVSVTATNFAPDGTLTLDTRVGDISLNVTGNASKAPVWVLGQLLMPQLRPVNDLVEIKLDGAPPEVQRIELPGRQIDAGKDLEISVSTRDFSRVVKVEATFEALAGQPIQPWAAAQTDNGVRWIAKLKTESVLPGTRHYVLVRATDSVGHESIERSDGISIVENSTTQSSSTLDEGPLE
jgi:Mg-chelatase subunit ChlD